MIARFRFAALIILTLIFVALLSSPTLTSSANAVPQSVPQFANAPSAAGTQSAYPILNGSDTVAPSGVQGRIVAWLRLRSGPGRSFSILGIVRYGSYVQVLARTPDGFWVAIRIGNTVGWVYKPFLRYLGGGSADVPVLTPAP